MEYRILKLTKHELFEILWDMDAGEQKTVAELYEYLNQPQHRYEVIEFRQNFMSKADKEDAQNHEI